MSILGKLLLVVNLLGVGGFIYLATQDLKGRQAITAAGLRHVLLLRGLPLDGGPDQLPARVPPSSDAFDDFITTEIPFHFEGPGDVPTGSISPERLYVYFAALGPAAPAGDGLGGPTPVASQMAEIKRVYGLIKTALQKEDGAKARAPLAGAWLLLQAESIEERTAVLALIAAKNGDQLAHRLDLKFHRVAPKLVEAGPIMPELWQQLPDQLKELEARRQKADEEATAAEGAATAAAGADDTDKDRRAATQKRVDALLKRAAALALAHEVDVLSLHPPKDEPETRSRLAHLLVHLDQAPAWQKRVMMVVGVQQYVKAVAAQMIRFRDMAARVEQATADDQDRFTAEYAQLRSLAIERTQKVREIADIRAQSAVQVQKDEEFVKQRETQLQGLKADLVKVKAEVDDLLAKQTLVEQQLFAVEREVGRTLEQIYQLEAELAQKEIAAYRRKK